MLRTARVCFWLACTVLTLALVDRAAAQQMPRGVEPRKLENDFRQQAKLINDLMRGEKKMDDPAAPAAVELLAKYLAFRITWQENLAKEGVVFSLVEYADRELGSMLARRPNNQAFIDAFLPQFIANASEVLTNERNIARVNGARLLHILAKNGIEEAADPLLEAIKDPQQNDGVRYWAFQGLGEVLGLPWRNPPIPIKDKARELAIVTTLIDFIQRKVVPPPGTSPQEIAGIHRLRREAVKALAQSRVPVALDDKKQVKGQTALVLLRVMRGDGITPAPLWPEKLEAAVGVARMQCKLYEPYQPDYAAYHLGWFAVEFAAAYEEAKLEERGWKVHATRLADALGGYDGMQSDVAKNKAREKQTTDYVTQVCEGAVKLLLRIDGKNTANPADFDAWLSSHPPPRDLVYRGVPDSKVTPPEPMGE